MTITITTHNNNPGLAAYVSQGAAVVAGMKMGAMHLNNININVNGHLEFFSLTGSGNISTQQGATIEVHNQCDPLLIQGNIDLRFPAASIPQAVTVDSGSNVTLQSESTNGLDLIINHSNAANPTIVTLTAGAVSSMIVNVDQNQYNIKSPQGEELTFGEFNAQEFDALSQYIMDNYDQATGDINLVNHQGELLAFKKYNKLLENTKFWYTTIIEEFREYEPTPFLFSADKFINNHWLEINGTNMNQTHLESLPTELMGYIAEYIADGEI